MHGQHQDPSASVSEASPQGYAQLQRQALAGVVAMSTAAVAPTTGETEQEYLEVKDRSQRQLDEALRHLEAEFGVRFEAARQEHERALRLENEHYQTESRSFKSNLNTAHDFLNSELDTARREARKKLDDTVWEADTVIQSTLAGLQQEYDAARRGLATAGRRLTALQGRAEVLRATLRDFLDDARGTPEVPPPQAANAAALFDEHMAAARDDIRALERMTLPRLLVGARPYITAALLAVTAAAVVGVLPLLQVPLPVPAAVAAGGLFVLTLGFCLAWVRPLRRRVRATVGALEGDLRRTLAVSDAALQHRTAQARRLFEEQEARARSSRDQDIAGARGRFESVVGRIEQRERASLDKIDSAAPRLHHELEQRHNQALRDIEQARRQRAQDLEQARDRELAAIRSRHEEDMAAAEARRDQAMAQSQDAWRAQLGTLARCLQAGRHCPRGWDNVAPSEPAASERLIPFGELQLNLSDLASSVRALPAFAWHDDPRQRVPAVLAVPGQGSLLLQTAEDGRQQAIATLRAIMGRLLTILPPGRVRFTIIDPVGLGRHFAGFMHLTDYEESLVGGRIWTEATHIEQRLADLTDHMETVIQRYLRNEFESIDEYNTHAGKLAEPYRYLVVADFPVHFSDEAARRLNHILLNGPRCGVYVLMAHDRSHKLPLGFRSEDLAQVPTRLQFRKERFVWQDDVYKHFPFTPDPPPDEARLTGLMQEVGRCAVQAMRVEVPFERITPQDEQVWSRSCSEALSVPVGLSGATRRQQLSLGEGVAQHVLIAGKTGSGKSTLLHVMITNLALWYSPDEVELYLVDFKKGVEFKTYATHGLAHARVIAIESDREFGLSVLQRLDLELQRRGDLFRELGVQELAAYRRTSGQAMPRSLLIVDEFQVLFAEDDRLAQDAAILLDRLVRQGRAFGIHVVLGSQTLGGTSRLPRSTMGQMAVRVALQCSEADSLLILDETNNAARALSRPGEGIYNDIGGLEEGNQPFQTAWLSDEQRDHCLQRVQRRVLADSYAAATPLVFEGNAPSDIALNTHLRRCLEPVDWTPSSAPRIWLGEAVAIKDPTSLTLSRQSGAHLLMVGQQDEAALGMTAAALLALAAQHAPARARFVVLDGTPAEAPTAGWLERLAAALPHDTRVLDPRQAEPAIRELAEELQRRQEADPGDAPSIYLVVYGMQRFRTLRRGDDDFGLSFGESARAPGIDRLLADLLRDGPPLGLHAVVWADTYAALERTLDRRSQGEFDHRVLFQMSTADSSNLIDSPLANKLGQHRALLFSEQQGSVEKFRPYALPEDGWLREVAVELHRRGA